jgi:hypothetical protein
MNISDLTLRLIFLLMPGAIAALIVGKLTFHRRWSIFSFILHSFLLGVGTYLLYQLILHLCGYIAGCDSKSLIFWDALFDMNIRISLKEIGLSCLFAIAIGYVASAIINHKLLFKSAKFVRVSNKFGDEDIWAYFLNSRNVTWIWVRDHPRKLIYEGWVQSFSVESSNREVLLREVKVFSNTDGAFLYSVPAMYISGKATDLTLELPKLGEEVVIYGGKERASSGRT